MTAAARFSRFALVAFIMMLSLSGCQFLRPSYGPVKPFSPAPARLGDILPQLEQRWPQVQTYQAEGAMSVSGGLTGRVGLTTKFYYRFPYQMRLRADRGALTVLEVLQSGDQVAILDNTSRRLYYGSVQQLRNSPEVIGGLEPLQVANALLIGHTFLRTVRDVQATGAEPQGIRFSGGTATLARKMASAGPNLPEQIEEYTIRRRDGLIQGVRLTEKMPDGSARTLTVKYNSWGGTAEHPYPKSMTIDSSNPRTRLRVTVDSATMNPNLQPGVFTVDPQRYQVMPLQELLQGTKTAIDTQ